MPMTADGSNSDSGDESPRIHRELEEQLRDLVRGQQRLYFSERESARQLACLEALATFAIASTELSDTSEILERAASLVFDLFPFEQCVAFETESGCLAPTVVRALEGLACSKTRLDEWQQTRLADPELEAPVLAHMAVLAERRDMRPLVDCFTALFGEGARRGDAPTLALPLERNGLMLFRRATHNISFHEELPSQNRIPFLSLLSRHVAASLANAKLVRSLEASYRELAAAQAAVVHRERLAALGELAAQVAHEVRNPLGAIFNAMSLLRPILVGREPDGAALLAVLEEESERINAIVSDLLEFSRPVPPAFQSEPVLSIVEAAIEAVHASMPTITIRLNGEPDLPQVQVDARMMRQALINLLTNAAQAIEDASPIDVHVRRDSGELRIDVVNRGADIASGVLARLFEPFFTTKATGTGLGLSVVKRSVDAHGGKVMVASSGGRTVFSVALPCLGDAFGQT
jgi:signal transduction histidine kinase